MSDTETYKQMVFETVLPNKKGTLVSFTFAEYLEWYQWGYDKPLPAKEHEATIAAISSTETIKASVWLAIKQWREQQIKFN